MVAIRLGFLFPAIVLMCLDPFMVVLGKPSRVYNFAVRLERRDSWIFHLTTVLHLRRNHALPILRSAEVLRYRRRLAYD